MSMVQVVSALFVVAVLASTIAPKTRLITRIGMSLLALCWLVVELVPYTGLYGEGSGLACATFVIGFPAAWLGFRRTTDLYIAYSPIFSRFATVLVIGGVVYLLPYLLATPILMRPAFSGIGCLSIGCGQMGPGPFNVYWLGPIPAAFLSIIGVCLTAVLGSWALNRASKAEPEAKPSE